MATKQKYQTTVYVRDVEKVSFVIESDDLEDDMENIIARAVHEGNYTDNMSKSNTDEAEHAWDGVERDEDNAGFTAYYGVDDECMIRVRKTQDVRVRETTPVKAKPRTGIRMKSVSINPVKIESVKIKTVKVK